MVLTPLSQRDTKWGSLKLGKSNLTISGFGCTTVCISIFLGVTPDKVASSNIYTASGLVDWQRIPSAWKQIKSVERGQTYDNQKVKDAIAKNGSCLVVVDYDGKIDTPRDSHWVLFIGNQKMIDPWDGKIKPTSTYPILKGFACLKRNDDKNQRPV